MRKTVVAAQPGHQVFQGAGHLGQGGCSLKNDLTPALDVEADGDGAPGRLWLCHASVRFLAGLREHAPDVKLVHSRRRQHIEAPLERHAADLAASGIDTMNFHYSEWTKGLVALFHRFDVNAFAWDVQEIRHLRAMLRFDVDAVYSDHVERMVTTVNEWLEQGDVAT